MYHKRIDHTLKGKQNPTSTQKDCPMYTKLSWALSYHTSPNSNLTLNYSIVLQLVLFSPQVIAWVDSENL